MKKKELDNSVKGSMVMNRILIEPKNDKITDAGIILPYDGKKLDGDAKIGVVKDVGPGAWDGGVQIPPEVKIGDLVLYLVNGAMYEYTKNDVKYDIIPESSILFKNP